MNILDSINAMSARDCRDALALGETNLPALPDEARARVRERLGAIAERLRRIEQTEAKIRYENRVLAALPEGTEFPVRWIATWMCAPGVCCMVGPCKASNTWGSEEDAQAWIRSAPADLVAVYDRMEARPVTCYPGTLEPTQCVFRVGDAQ